MTSRPIQTTVIFLNFHKPFCAVKFSESIHDTSVKFSGLIDNRLMLSKNGVFIRQRQSVGPRYS